jgi:dolichol-phosphate mannosyltransferase
MKISIVLCVFDEIRVIQDSFERLKKDCDNRGLRFEIIIVDNNSSDGTREWLESFEDDSVVKIFNKVNIGKGGSIKKAINVAKGEYLVIFDPDQEYENVTIWDSLLKIEETGAKCVLGSRRLGNRRNYKYPLNYYGVVVLTTLINILYGTKLTDAATAVKCFDLDFLKSIPLISNGFNLDFELVCRVAQRGGNIDEVQANYFPRSKAEGKKLNALRDGFLSLIVILITWLPFGKNKN